MILTNLTLPESIFTKLNSASPKNRSFFVRAVLPAFLESRSCSTKFIASLPDLGKTHTIGHRGDLVKLTIPVKFEKPVIREYRKQAKKLSEGSLSLLTAAALYWHFQCAAKA